MATPKIDPALHQERKPDWIKVRLPSNPVFFSTKAMISDLRLHTVCESAQCPNRWECWSGGTATMMIAGDRCTRACGFCAVDTAKPFPLEHDEPERVAEPVVASVFEGYNGTVFAYGQTGSGKTFTLTGGVNAFGERGIIQQGGFGQVVQRAHAA